MKSYDYANRDGLDRVTWERFHALSKAMSEKLAERRIDLILGVARAGLFPATAIACALRLELAPIRLSRREGDKVKFSSPQWRVPVPAAVAGKRVVIVAEMPTLERRCELRRQQHESKVLPKCSRRRCSRIHGRSRFPTLFGRSRTRSWCFHGMRKY